MFQNWRSLQTELEREVVSGIAPNGSTGLPPSGRRAGFPRSIRLLRHEDFERVYKLGKRHFALHLTVFYLRRAEGGSLRVGFTVGRVLGGAVERNRIKRRLREAVRLRAALSRAAVDIVVHPKKSALTAAFAELRDEIGRAFELIEKSQRNP